MLVIEPSGELINLPIELLRNTPFENYLIPGIILLTILGNFPLYVLYGFWKGSRWTEKGAFTAGVILIIWIIVEILMIGYQPDPPLQLIYGITGFCIFVFSIMSLAEERQK